MLKKALETAILFTLKNCCDQCDGGGNEPNPEFRCHCVNLFGKKSYEEIICQIGNIECGDFWFPLDIPPSKEEQIAEFGEYADSVLSCKNYVDCKRGGCDPVACPDYEKEE